MYQVVYICHIFLYIFFIFPIFIYDLICEWKLPTNQEVYHKKKYELFQKKRISDIFEIHFIIGLYFHPTRQLKLMWKEAYYIDQDHTNK